MGAFQKDLGRKSWPKDLCVKETKVKSLLGDTLNNERGLLFFVLTQTGSHEHARRELDHVIKLGRLSVHTFVNYKNLPFF